MITGEDPQRNTITTHEEKSSRPQRGKKKSACRGKCLSDPSTVRRERQQGETAEHHGAARADVTLALRKGWAGSQRAPTHPEQGPD